MKHLLFVILYISFLVSSWAQPADGQIVTAVDFFSSVSEKYAEIKDYEALVTITHNDLSMEGHLYYKNPDLILISFTNPKDQVISVKDSKLIIYLPQKNVSLSQDLSRGGDPVKGLDLFRRGYTFAWVTNYELVPLEEGSPEMVYKLKLGWRSTDEGFREIEMSVGKNMLIRRLAGVTKNYDELVMDFKNIRINQNIPEARFDFTSPPSAYEITNFIYADE
ncbi:MAG: outer membrane lipoprotein carrier protein LolA [Spirochaetales bacterium]|nr:outer membrane lipoprotein carrier protein LolA [Spirochaetales bacterium]